MLVKDIVKKTLMKIQRDGMTVTPELYGKTFCAEAKRAGLKLDECRPAGKYIEKLDEKASAEAKAKNIEQLDDLLTFLIAFHKREKSSNSAKQGNSSNDKTYKEYSKILTEALEPSFTQKLKKRINRASTILAGNPAFLSQSLKKELEDLIYTRIDLDREDIVEHTDDLEESINHIIKSLSTLITIGNSKSGSIAELKEALGKMRKDEFSAENFITIKEKLTKVANSLDDEIVKMISELKEKKDEVGELKNKVETLQKDLEDAKKESREDFLTKVLTKRALIAELEALDSLFKRKKENFAIVFLDLDHFKKVNDTYGHDAGDLVLKAFGETIKKNVRKSDHVGRFGGEEFIILLPGYGLEEGKNFAEKMRKIVETSKIIYKKHEIKLTVSGGVSQRSDCEDGDATLKDADDKLYVAKSGGRNMIV